MDINAIIKRVIGMITKPKDEWNVVKGETLTVADFYMKYVIILAAIPAIASFIGYAFIGISYGFGTFRFSIGTSLTVAIVNYVSSLIGVFVMAFVIDALAPTFGAKKDMVESMKVVVFSYMPVWILGILLIIPSLAVLVGLGGLYALYLLYTGLGIIKEPPQDKAMGYFIVSLLVVIGVYFVIYFISGRIIAGAYTPAFTF